MAVFNEETENKNIGYSQAYFSISPSNYDIGFWMVRERESADDCCYFYVPNWDLFIMFYVPT